MLLPLPLAILPLTMAPETFDKLIEEVEAGTTLKGAIRAAGTSYRALQLIVERDEEAATRYARARLASADFYADKAQDAVESAKTVQDATIGRIKAEVYRWRAKMANPRVYGDKVDVTSDGKAIQAAVVVMPPEQIPDGEYEVVDAPQTLPAITSGEPETPESAPKDAV